MSAKSGRNDTAYLYLLAAIALFVAAWSLHWFITPDAWRVTAPTGRRIATALQALFGAAVGIWAFRRARRMGAPKREGAE